MDFNVCEMIMLITDKFVFVHQPKTGGTFVQDILNEFDAKETRLRNFGLLRKAGLLPRRFACRDVGEYHSNCHEIPLEDRNKPVLSIVRNPLDYYVSFYHYGWWATHPEDSYADFGKVLKRFPQFPDLSFEDFLVLANEYFPELEQVGADPHDPDRIGYYSAQFLLFFFKEPQVSLATLDERISEGCQFSEEMFNVRFLRTDRLNADLPGVLEGFGYPRSWTAPLSLRAPVLPDQQREQRPTRDFQSYYTPETRAMIFKRDRLLFKMFGF